MSEASSETLVIVTMLRWKSAQSSLDEAGISSRKALTGSDGWLVLVTSP